MIFKDYCNMQSNYYQIKRDVLNNLMGKSFSWVQSNIDSICRDNKSLKVIDDKTDNYLLIKIVGKQYHVRNSKGKVKLFDRFTDMIEVIK